VIDQVVLSLRWLLVICVAAPCFGWRIASAETGTYALDHAAIALKNPVATPLVAITRMGQRLFAVGLHGVILMSSDSGVTWRQVPVPVDVTLTAVYFKSARQGWAVGHFGVILYTGNGGRTWSRVVDGLDVIKALNASAALAQSTAAGTPDAQLKLRVATAYQNAGPSKPFLAVGACGNGILSAGQQDLAMFSADDGKTWKEWTSAIDNPTFRNIYAITSLGNSPILVGEDGLVLQGDANCRNFKPLPGPYAATLFGAINKEPASLLLYGIDGASYLSRDNASTWRAVSLGTGSVIDAGLLLPSGNMLLGTLDGNLYLSDASLQNFHQISVYVPFQIAGLEVAPNGNLVVVGNGGIRIIPSASIR
jgi:photosystem II stability/assembly factor-like uncharacterized protein